jgi:hypothetical protein
VALIVQTLVALAIGCGLAALGAALDQRIHGRNDVAAVYDGPVLGDVRTPRERAWLPGAFRSRPLPTARSTPAANDGTLGGAGTPDECARFAP